MDLTIVNNVAFVLSGSGSYTVCDVDGDGLFSNCAVPAAPYDAVGTITASGYYGILTPASGTTLFFPVYNTKEVRACTIDGKKLTGCVDAGVPSANLDYPEYGVIANGYSYIANYYPSAPPGLVTICSMSGNTFGACSSGATVHSQNNGVAVSADGQTLFVAQAAGFESCPIINGGAGLGTCTPLSISDLGYTPGEPYDIVISGNTAYIADVIDLTLTICDVVGAMLKNCVPNTSATYFTLPVGIFIS